MRKIHLHPLKMKKVVLFHLTAYLRCDFFKEFNFIEIQASSSLKKGDAGGNMRRGSSIVSPESSISELLTIIKVLPRPPVSLRSGAENRVTRRGKEVLTDSLNTLGFFTIKSLILLMNVQC